MIVGTPPAIRYVLTLDDLVDGNRFVLRTFRLLVTGIGIVALAASAILWGSGGGPVVSVAALGYGVLDLALLWARPIERLLLRRRVARLVGNECEVAVTDQALAFRQAGMKGEFAWTDLTGVREDGRTIAVVSGGVTRMGIPKRVFGSAAELADFRRAVLARINANTSRRDPPE